MQRAANYRCRDRRAADCQVGLDGPDNFSAVSRKEKVLIMATKSKKPTTTNVILANRVELDLIEQLERVRDLLDEETSVSGYFQISTRHTLREAIDYLMQLREQRLNAS